MWVPIPGAIFNGAWLGEGLHKEYDEDGECHGGHEHNRSNKAEKVRVVLPANARVEPIAVVIEYVHALVAVATVLGASIHEGVAQPALGLGYCRLVGSGGLRLAALTLEPRKRGRHIGSTLRDHSASVLMLHGAVTLQAALPAVAVAGVDGARDVRKHEDC